MTASTMFQQVRSPRAAVRVALLAGCLLPAVFGAAQAATPDETVPSIVVNYDDLNLATKAGSQELYRRIVSAARHVCPRADGRDLGTYAQSRSCQAQAIQHAVEDVHSPQLAAVYAQRSNRG